MSDLTDVRFINSDKNFPFPKKRGFHVAIDGPVGAGKSTIAKRVAERLGFVYLDTGAMYRAVTLRCLNDHVSLDDEQALKNLLEQIDLEIHPVKLSEDDDRLCTIIMNGIDVSNEIRSTRVDDLVPKVASIPQVRNKLVFLQKKISKGVDAVVEGRDISYKVLPNADLKIYLTASEIVRARRHYQRLIELGQAVDFDSILKSLIERDLTDRTRSVDPLKIVPDAWVLNTSNLSIEQVIEKIVDKVRQL